MNFLFEVAGLSVPLVQEIVWLSELKYDVLDCLKPPHYFIPKGSVAIENHTGHNLAQHGKLENPPWLGLPPETPSHVIKEIIRKVLNRQVEITIYLDRILYWAKTDKQLLLEQNKKYGWDYDWANEQGLWKDCIFNDQNRLNQLRLSHNKRITKFDPNLFAELEQFHCNHTSIQYLNISWCIQLYRLDCSFTKIGDLDVSQCTQLESLSCCHNNYLTKLDVSQCTQLESLYCHYTQIKELDVSQCTQLQQLHCHNINLKELDLSQCIQLRSLDCAFNTRLKELNLSQCTQLESLYCHYTQIKELDLTRCTQLQELYCSKNQIEELDLSQCTQLQKLNCSNTQIKELDLSQCTQLQLLNCHSTQLKEVELTKCVNLTVVFVTGCQNLKVIHCLQQLNIFNKPKHTNVQYID